MPRETSDATYQTIAAAIRYVRANARRQPELGEIAAHLGQSPFHLQRLFHRWAGISPKRFVQFLTRQHARELLRQSRDVLSTALASGLSGPGRLHDLLVACDAVTPGEMAARGAGLEIAYGFAATPCGPVMVGLTARGVCHLRFCPNAATGLAELRAEWPAARLTPGDGAAAVAGRLFQAGGEGPLPGVLLCGTNFQIKVWEALLRIPAGRLVSYGDLARRVGAPGAARAVGSAVAANPVAVLIPCHRVIRESGEFGDYRWGSERKAALLVHEGARVG